MFHWLHKIPNNQNTTFAHDIHMLKSATSCVEQHDHRRPHFTSGGSAPESMGVAGPQF